MKPRIFIGSSSENKEIAEAIQNNLMDISYPEIWDQNIKSLSQSTLSNLIKAIKAFDFAIFVFGAEDKATIRDKDVSIIRDNIIFETGLFMGRLGMEHVFFVKPQNQELHMPSDLLGITYGIYDIEHPNKDAALRPFCKQVKEQIRQSYYPEFPNTGNFGFNILTHLDIPLLSCSTPCKSEMTYGLYAITSVSQKLVIKITNESNDSNHNVWCYGVGQIQGWIPSTYNGSQEFTLHQNTRGILKLYFVGSGYARIEARLNDNSTPFMNREIRWQPK